MMSSTIHRIAVAAMMTLTVGPVALGGGPTIGYALAPNSDVMEGCFGGGQVPLCKCPIFFFEDFTGTFGLTVSGSDTFAVTDIEWTVEPMATQVTGSGTYQLSDGPGGEILQQLTLDLFFDVEGPVAFDSGLVEGGDAGFPPDISILVSDGIDCGGRRMTITAAPLAGPPADIAPAGGDGLVNTADLLMVLAEWGTPAPNPADIDGSGMVDTADLLIVRSTWTG